MKCETIFLFFILIELKVFYITQNETHKMVKISASTNKLSKKLRNMSKTCHIFSHILYLPPHDFHKAYPDLYFL